MANKVQSSLNIGIILGTNSAKIIPNQSFTNADLILAGVGSGGVKVASENTTNPTFIVQGFLSQTSNLFELHDDVGSVLTYFDKDGNLNIPSLTTTTSLLSDTFEALTGDPLHLKTGFSVASGDSNKTLATLSDNAGLVEVILSETTTGAGTDTTLFLYGAIGDSNVIRFGATNDATASSIGNQGSAFGMVNPDGNVFMQAFSSISPANINFETYGPDVSGAGITLAGYTYAGGTKLAGSLFTIKNSSITKILVDYDGKTQITPTNSSAGTDLLINPAIKTSGNLIETLVGGSSVFSVNYAGTTVAPIFEAPTTSPLDLRAGFNVTSGDSGKSVLSVKDLSGSNTLLTIEETSGFGDVIEFFKLGGDTGHIYLDNTLNNYIKTSATSAMTIQSSGGSYYLSGSTQTLSTSNDSLADYNKIIATKADQASAITSGNILNLYNATTSKFAVDYDGKTKITPTNSTGLTDLLIDSAIKTSGYFVDLQVASSSVFNIDYAGITTATNFTASTDIKTPLLKSAFNSPLDLRAGFNVASGDTNKEALSLKDSGGTTTFLTVEESSNRSFNTISLKLTGSQGYFYFDSVLNNYITTSFGKNFYYAINGHAFQGYNGNYFQTYNDSLLDYNALTVAKADGVTAITSGNILNLHNATTSVFTVDYDGKTEILPTNSTGLTDLLINPGIKTSGYFVDLQIGIVSKVSIDYAGVIDINSDDVTVTNKNKYRPLLSYGGDIVLRYQDYYYNGSSYSAMFSYGLGKYALQNNSGRFSNGFGYSALMNNTGIRSNGFGNNTLLNNTGDYSNGFGEGAVGVNTGNRSNGLGYNTLQFNTGENSNGFGYFALKYNTGDNSNGFGNNALNNNIGANSNGYGYYALQNNNWGDVIAIGNQVANVFDADATTDQAFAYSDVNATNHTITFSSPHGFGTTGTKVNLLFTLTAGTAPTGLVNNTVYQFTITSNTILTLASIASQGSTDFTGKLTNSIDVHNSIAIGNNAKATKANQVVLGDSNIVETVLHGNIIGDTLTLTSPNSTGLTDLLINPTIKTSGNFLDMQINSGSSLFSVDYAGNIVGAGYANVNRVLLNSTALLATPQAGSIEFYNDRIYITNVGNQRVVDRTSNVIDTTTTVENTTVESTLFSETLPANAIKPKNVIQMRANGPISSANGNQSVTFRLYAGPTLLETYGVILSGATDLPWVIDVDMTVRSIGVTGTVTIYSKIDFGSGYDNTAISLQTLDTTISETMRLTVQWGTAKTDNIATLYSGYLTWKG